jgi:hypothetical protein
MSINPSEDEDAAPPTSRLTVTEQSQSSTGRRVAIGEGTVPDTAVLMSDDPDGEPIYVDTTPLRDDDPIYQAMLQRHRNRVMGLEPPLPPDPDLVITTWPMTPD